MFVWVWLDGWVGHSHPESPESRQSVLQSLLLAGGHMCYMSPPLLLLLLTHEGYVQLNVHYKTEHQNAIIKVHTLLFSYQQWIKTLCILGGISHFYEFTLQSFTHRW